MTPTHIIRQERDALFLADLLRLGFAPTPAATLLFCSYTGDGTKSAYERINENHRSGHLTRLPWEHSRAFAIGALPDLLTAAARRPLDTLTDMERKAWETLAQADKQRALDLLDSVSVDTQEAGRMMRYHSETARSLIARTQNTGDHLALTATLASILMFFARVSGWEVNCLRGDGEVELASKVEFKEATRTVTRKPDLTLVLTDHDGSDAYLIGAEPGSASVGKVRDKLLAYDKLIEAAGGTDGFKAFGQECAGTDPLRSVRIVFYCQTDKHLDAVAASMAKVLGVGRHESFALVPASQVHLDVPSLAHRDNAADSVGVRVLDTYQTLLQGDVSGTVTVRDDHAREGERVVERRAAEVSWGPLVKLPSAPSPGE